MTRRIVAIIYVVGTMYGYVRGDNSQIEKREIFYVNDGDAFRTMTTKMTRVKNWQASTKRKPSPKSTFLHDITTVLKVIRAIGLYPAQIIRSIDDDSEPTKTSVGWLFYSSCIYAFILYNVFYISADYVTRLLSPAVPFNVSVYLFANFLAIQIFTVVPFTHWLNWRKYDRLVKIWAQFLIYYETMTNRYPRQQSKIIIHRGLLTGVILIVIVASYNVYNGVPGKIYVIFEFCGLVTIFTATITIYSLFCQNIRDAADDLVCVIRQLSVDSPREYDSRLEKTLSMWIQLSNIMNDVTATFSLNLIIALLCQFVSGSLALFGQVIRLLKKYHFNDSTLMSFIFQCCDSVAILIMCNVSYKTTKHMGKRIRKEILLHDLTRLDLVEVQQVAKFLQVVQLNYPRTRLSGVVKLNRKLFLKIYSSLAAYMIVLVQFQLTLMYQSS